MTVLPALRGGAAVTLFALGILAAPAVLAQTAPPPPETQLVPSPPMQPPAPAATPSETSRVDRYIANLHKRLKITAAEESQWKTVADIMRENARAIDSLASQRAAQRQNMSAVDNLRSYEEMADAHADGLKKLVPAFAALYDSMPEAQKKNADAVFAEVPRQGRKARG